MADTVQYRMELMSSELDELEERGLFKRREIAEIVKQRRKFEYRLKRPSPIKDDFIAYIEYEKRIDNLRVLRKKIVGLEGYDGKKKEKKTGSDYAGEKRILDIYGRATKRFKGDVELWFRYLEFCRERKNGQMKKEGCDGNFSEGDVELWFRYMEFCRERKNGQMKKIQAKMFRLHPKVPGVWIYAAAWEFDHNADVEAARNLMQNGLRNCPYSEDLWVEYLRMELTYLNKLKARKVALGEDKGTLVRSHRKADEKQWKDENKELFMSLDQKRENDEKENDGLTSVVEEGETKTGLDLFCEQGLSILQTVYSGAVGALPSCFGLRKRFIEILEATNLDHSEKMRRNILADMKIDFSTEPEYWDWLARSEITDSNRRKTLVNEIVHFHFEKAIQVYEDAIEVLPSAMMFSLYTGFLRETIAPPDREKQSSGILYSDRDLDLISRILKVYERAANKGCITEDLAYQHVTLYLQLGKLEEAKSLAKDLCGELLDAVDLWVLRISIEMRCITEMSGSMTKADLPCVFNLLKKVLSNMRVPKAESLWVMALKTFAKHRDYLDKLVELSLCCLTRDGGSDDGFSLSSAVIELLLQTDGIENARKAYKRFIALPRPGLVFYKSCIELEVNLAIAGDRDSLVKARKLYESALATYKDDTCLWQNYYSMEIKLGTSKEANSVYWRAKKQLKENVVLLSSANL